MTKREIMLKAVARAKKMEGDWIARMKMALKLVWAIAKKAVEIKVVRPIEKMKQKLEDKFNAPRIGTSLKHLTLNLWEKYGKSRLYVNGINHGYFDFDESGNLKKWYFDCGYDYKTKSELEAIANLIQIGEF